MRKRLLNPFAMFVIGLCAGVLSRLLDIYTQNLGEIFSQMAVWILFGTLISIYSHTPKKAAANGPLKFLILGTQQKINQMHDTHTIDISSSQVIHGHNIFGIVVFDFQQVSDFPVRGVG